MDERDGRTRQVAFGRFLVESLPRVDHKDGRPAKEEEDDDDQEHADDTLLGHQVGCGAAAAHPPHRRFAAGGAKAARTQRQAFPFRLWQVAAVTVSWLNAALSV